MFIVKIYKALVRKRINKPSGYLSAGAPPPTRRNISVLWGEQMNGKENNTEIFQQPNGYML